MSMTACANPTWDMSQLEKNIPRHMLTGEMRYRDFQKIGSGGKSEVFQCRDVYLNRNVAYKVLHPSFLVFLDLRGPRMAAVELHLHSLSEKLNQD